MRLRESLREIRKASIADEEPEAEKPKKAVEKPEKASKETPDEESKEMPKETKSRMAERLEMLSKMYETKKQKQDQQKPKK